MSQNYDLPLATDTLADSRPQWNDALDSIKSGFSGATEPASAIRTAYMLWIDTTAGKIKRRNAANDGWITLGDFALNQGMLHLTTSGQALGADLSMGGFRLTNLGNPTAATDAARKQELDLKAPIASPAFTGQATVNQDPTGNDSLARKSWLDATFLKLAGGTMTGRTALQAGAPTAGAADYLRRDEIELLTSFNTSTGHNHDGTNSRAVLNTAIFDVAEQQLFSQAAGNDWTLVNVDTEVGSNNAYAIYCNIHYNVTLLAGAGNSATYDVFFRRPGATNYLVHVGHEVHGVANQTHQGRTRNQVIIPVDASNEFEYKIDVTANGVSSRAITLNINGYTKR